MRWNPAARLIALCIAVGAVAAAAPARADAASGPVAAYGFEDTGPGSAGDSSALGNTGSVQGAVRVPGRHGTGVSFDGVNDRIAVPDAGPLNLASGMTLEAWVKPEVTTGWRTVVLKERRSGLSYGIYGSHAGVATQGTDRLTTLSGFEAGVWTHLAATYDGTTLRAYANGVEVGQSTAAGGPITPGDGPLSIGGNTIWGEWFKGVIDEVRVYDRPLAAAEIQADMAAPVGPPATTSTQPGPAEVGAWSAPQSWPMVAVHTSMLSNGKVVAWDAFGAALQSEHVWDPETGQFQGTPSGINLFCAGHVLLPNGKLFVAGGHELGYVGLRDTRLFDSDLRSWTVGPDMARGRWYPTTTTLPDGRVLIVSGDGIRPGPNDPFFVRPSDTIPEIYDPKTNTITAMPSAGRLMPLYPYMFVAPDGRVADVGPDTTTRLLDTSSGQWATLASQSPITGGSAVMYRPGKVLKTGTWTDTDFGNPAIHSRSAVLDLDQTVPAWRNVASMKWARTYHTLTVLPDGDVLALGGQSAFGANSLVNSPVLQGEIWDPDTDTWKPTASNLRPRGYHNTSLLLPDGRILLAGSGRLDGSLMVNEMSSEIYSPPYLSKGPRPTITYAPQTMLYGGKIAVQTPDAARIAKVSLVRMGAVTHNINMDQRWQQLSFRQTAGGLEIDAPTSANIAPPGVYYVFLLDDQGVPSKAAILSIPAEGGTPPPDPDPDPDPDTSVPSVSVSAPVAGATVRGQVSVEASASDNVGVSQVRFELDGQPLGSPDTSAPYTVSWDTTAAAAGSHALRAIASDAAGNQATSATVSVTVDNSVPAGPVPVAAYAFEDGAGATLTDVTGKGHTGTIREATWTTAGKYGKALTFDGVNDWVTINDANDLDLAGAMTLEAWVYPTRNTAWRTAVMKENGSDLAWALYSSGSAKPSAWAATGTGMGSTTGPTAPALNAWTHMAATYDGTNLRLFVNGTQVSSAARAGLLATGTGALRLGGNGIWSEWFTGRLDDIRIYDRALTPTQIQTDMNTPAGAAPPPPAPDASPPSAPTGLSAANALGRVTLSWTASTDNVGVARYVVHRSPTSGFTPSALTRIATPTTTSLADLGLPVGRYYYRVLAEDAAGNASAPSAEVAGDSLADTSVPSVSVSAPVAGATVRGQVSVEASASDNVGVSQVRFELDGQPLGSPDTSAPYTVSWDTTAAAAGSHALRAIASDAAGNQATSATVSVTVDNSVPAGPVPVAAYAFEDGAGATLTDVTGKGHTGTIREATWTTAGKYGKALTFDGVNDWVTINDANDLDLAGAMTLEAWVYPTRNTAWRTAVMKENGSDLAWALYSSGSAKPSAWAATGTGMGSTTGPTAPALNAWTHMAATYDGTNLRLFVNGTQVSSAARAGLLATGTGALRLGGNGIWSEWFTGRLDDIRIYDRALTPTQIQTDMNTPAG